jgi:septum site-determining protein MinD
VRLGTSGKGGVGKTTTTANIAAGIAQHGHKTVAIDFDVGLRNLDLVLGCERRVVYDFVNVLRGEAKLNVALIRDKRIENLYVLPASQTRDKDALDASLLLPCGAGGVVHACRTAGVTERYRHRHHVA